MNGMHYEHHAATNPDDFPNSESHEYQLRPTATIGQLSISGLWELDDESFTSLLFGDCTFLDSDGVTRNRTLNQIAFSQNGLASVTFGTALSSCSIRYLVNFFFWDSVF